MRHLLILLGILVAGAPMTMAQWDDIYYNPNKKEKTKVVKENDLTTGSTGRTDITVDQYNMRGFGGTNALAIDTIGAQIAAEPDFVYTGQIQKYYNPTIIVDNADVLSDVINNSYGNVNVIISNGVPVLDVYDYSWPSYGWSNYYGYGWGMPTWSLYWSRPYGYNFWNPYYSWAYNPYYTYNPYWWTWSPVYDYWLPYYTGHFTYGKYNPHGNQTYRLPEAMRHANANRSNISHANSNYRTNRSWNGNIVNGGGSRPNTLPGYRTNSNVNRNETQSILNGQSSGYRNNSSNRNNSNNNVRMHGNTNTGATFNGGTRSYGNSGTMRSNGVHSGMGGGTTRGTATGGSRIGGGSGSIRR